MAEQSGQQSSSAEAHASAGDVAKSVRSLQDARDAVRDAANGQKAKVASRLHGVAEALHETAKSLERQNASVGRYTDLAADQVDRLSQILRERPVEDLMDNAEQLARSQPLLFVGGALAAGFVLARVVKSTQPPMARRAVGDVADEARATADRAMTAADRVARGTGQGGGASQGAGGPAHVSQSAVAAEAARPTGAPTAEPYRSGGSSSGGL